VEAAVGDVDDPGVLAGGAGDVAVVGAEAAGGRARVEAGVRRGTAFFDFSAAPGMDPADPATWWSCMPGLGHTVREQTVREDFEAMDLVDFEAEYLGWEPVSSSGWKVVPKAAWKNAEDLLRSKMQPGGRVFAVDADPKTGVYALWCPGCGRTGAGTSRRSSSAAGRCGWCRGCRRSSVPEVRKRVHKPPVILLKTAVASHLVDGPGDGPVGGVRADRDPVRAVVLGAGRGAPRRTGVPHRAGLADPGMGGAAKRTNVEGGWKWDRDAPGQSPLIGATLARWGVRMGYGKLPKSKVF
jgi:hypothetical protein